VEQSVADRVRSPSQRAEASGRDQAMAFGCLPQPLTPRYGVGQKASAFGSLTAARPHELDRRAFARLSGTLGDYGRLVLIGDQC
jgi:hypothetical protein